MNWNSQFADHFKQFFVKLVNQNFHSVRIFAFRETSKFLFTLLVWQFAHILIKKVLNCTIIFCIWMVFWPQSPNRGVTVLPPYPQAVELHTTFSQIISKKIQTMHNPWPWTQKTQIRQLFWSFLLGSFVRKHSLQLITCLVKLIGNSTKFYRLMSSIHYSAIRMLLRRRSLTLFIIMQVGDLMLLTVLKL